MALPTIGADISLTPLSALGTLFRLLSCLVQLRYKGFCLILLYLVLSFLVVVSFLKREQRGCEFGGEEKQEVRMEGG